MSQGTDHRVAYINVWLGLLALTVTTVGISYIEFGIFNIVVAMLIATVKAVLVCLYFMHLKYENRVNQVIFISSFVFLLIFIMLTISDVMYRPNVLATKALELSSPHH